MTCRCGLEHFEAYCETAQQLRRAEWRERQAAKEGLQGFRYVNRQDPLGHLSRSETGDRRGAMQGTSGDFIENFR